MKPLNQVVAVAGWFAIVLALNSPQTAWAQDHQRAHRAAVDKGTAIEALLGASDATAAIYAGDDRTDLDGFGALERLVASGRLRTALRVGVASAEGPAEILERADLTVASPAELVPLLAALAG